MITIDPPSTSFDPSALNKSALTRFLNRARAAIGLHGDVEVLLTSDAAIQRLNRTFRARNKPTDILSFPAAPEAGTAGDLAISLETAGRQAAEHAHPLQAELKILLLHGLLHLAGEDHETDSGEMAARELALRRQLGLPAGLIERAQ
jgi:probable rRNA maturation factor